MASAQNQYKTRESKKRSVKRSTQRGNSDNVPADGLSESGACTLSVIVTKLLAYIHFYHDKAVADNIREISLHFSEISTVKLRHCYVWWCYIIDASICFVVTLLSPALGILELSCLHVICPSCKPNKSVKQLKNIQCTHVKVKCTVPHEECCLGAHLP